MDCTGDTDHDGNLNVEGEWQFSNLARGAHCFSVYATDGAGRQSPTTQLLDDRYRRQTHRRRQPHVTALPRHQPAAGHDLH